jgi:hypothetical protein
MKQSLEAAMGFVSRLDPDFDQIGLVTYAGEVTRMDELECLRSRPGACNMQVFTNTVLTHLNETNASGGTAIPGALRRGVEVLESGSCSPNRCGRPGAASVMILLTDGEANNMAYTESACDDEDLFPDQPTDTADKRQAKDCTMYYAREARDGGVVIYTIALGLQADKDLMEAVAEMTGGHYEGAATPDQLDEIFDMLFDHIFLRLIN